jgi:hypothetical protein
MGGFQFYRMIHTFEQTENILRSIVSGTTTDVPVLIMLVWYCGMFTDLQNEVFLNEYDTNLLKNNSMARDK